MRSLFSFESERGYVSATSTFPPSSRTSSQAPSNQRHGLHLLLSVLGVLLQLWLSAVIHLCHQFMYVSPPRTCIPPAEFSSTCSSPPSATSSTGHGAVLHLPRHLKRLSRLLVVSQAAYARACAQPRSRPAKLHRHRTPSSFTSAAHHHSHLVKPTCSTLPYQKIELLCIRVIPWISR
jgi:hypothetical protein